MQPPEKVIVTRTQILRPAMPLSALHKPFFSLGGSPGQAFPILKKTLYKTIA